MQFAEKETNTDKMCYIIAENIDKHYEVLGKKGEKQIKKNAETPWMFVKML